MKLFWSWQSDNHQESGRYFVRTVLADLAVELNSEPEDAERPEADDENEANRIRIDHDTLGVGGSPVIAETILKKIREAAVFVADVTPVGKTVGGKLLPNPNVMIELGYALKVLEHERIVLVMNRAEGAALKHLPFDLRHWRAPVTYSLHRSATEEQRAEVARQLSAGLRTPIEASLKAAVRAQRNEHRRTVREPVLSVELDPEDAGPWIISQSVADLGVKTLATIQAETPQLPLPQRGVSSRLGPSQSSISSLSGFRRQKPVSQWTHDEIDRYNRSLNHYYREYEAYLNDVTEFKRLALRTFEVKLQVLNNGTAPATGIDVYIQFPANLALYDGRKGLVAPKSPEAPEQVALGRGEAIGRFVPHDLGGLLAPPRERSEFCYPEKRLARFKIAGLKHHHLWSADPILLSFVTAADIGPFEIEYKITANEPIEPITGTVRLEFFKDDTEG